MQSVKSNVLNKVILANNRFRRNIFIAIVAFILIVYLFKFRSSDNRSDSLDICINSLRHPFNAQIESNNLIKVQEDRILPFIGNGFISITEDDSNKLFLKSTSEKHIFIPNHPLFDVSVNEYEGIGETYLDILSGSVKKFTCFKYLQHCLMLEKETYAHRSYASILVQQFTLSNPTVNSISLYLSSPRKNKYPDSKYKEITISTNLHISVQENVIRPIESEVIAVVVVSMLTPKKIKINPNNKWSYNHITVIRNATLNSDEQKEKLKVTLSNLYDLAKKDLLNYLEKETIYYKQHTSIWNKFWRSGFGVSISKAAGELNGDQINATIYYSATNTLYQDEDNISIADNSENCYSGHHTRQNKNMWKNPKTSLELFDLVKVWRNTLEKFGCTSLLKSGTNGLQQAMILSLGALKFTNRHLEYQIHPKELHRDFYFRNLRFQNGTDLNISVKVGEDNKAQLDVMISREGLKGVGGGQGSAGTTSEVGVANVYACDAGCQDTVVKLSADRSTSLPVKLTDPLTAILYVSSDRRHLDEMRTAIHVAHLAVADAHEQHVISYHRHGNHYGGLPNLFWACVVLLIVLFHAFLFKLVYNEYCRDSPHNGQTSNSAAYSRLRYNP